MNPQCSTDETVSQQTADAESEQDYVCWSRSVRPESWRLLEIMTGHSAAPFHPIPDPEEGPSAVEEILPSSCSLEI